MDYRYYYSLKKVVVASGWDKSKRSNNESRLGKMNHYNQRGRNVGLYNINADSHSGSGKACFYYKYGGKSQWVNWKDEGLDFDSF